MENLDLEQLKQIVKEAVLEAMQEFKEPINKLSIGTEINPSAKYKPQDAHKLIGISERHLSRLALSNELDYQINKRTGHRMYKGTELIKFRNNNPI